MSNHLRVTFLTPLTTTVVLRTLTVTVTAPQRSASTAGPETVRVTTIFFGVAAAVALFSMAATAFAVGSGEMLTPPEGANTPLDGTVAPGDKLRGYLAFKGLGAGAKLVYLANLFGSLQVGSVRRVWGRGAVCSGGHAGRGVRRVRTTDMRCRLQVEAVRAEARQRMHLG